MGSKLISWSFAQKIIKKIEMLAFSNKTKIIEASVPEKVKHYLDSYFGNEINFFQKKYKFKIIINSNRNLIIPEYKILLLNKNKKLINKIESLIQLNGKRVSPKNTNKAFKQSEKKTSDNLALGKILWTRRKKRNLN